MGFELEGFVCSLAGQSPATRRAYEGDVVGFLEWLERAGVTPDQGPVIVTGAAGGVGSVAVALLAGLEFEVTQISVADEMRLHTVGVSKFDALVRFAEMFGRCHCG